MSRHLGLPLLQLLLLEGGLVLLPLEGGLVLLPLMGGLVLLPLEGNLVLLLHLLLHLLQHCLVLVPHLPHHGEHVLIRNVRHVRLRMRMRRRLRHPVRTRRKSCRRRRRCRGRWRCPSWGGAIPDLASQYLRTTVKTMAVVWTSDGPSIRAILDFENFDFLVSEKRGSFVS